MILHGIGYQGHEHSLPPCPPPPPPSIVFLPRLLLCAIVLHVLQMLELPANGEGLAWIAAQGLAKLLLRPGVQAACITAAAEGDQQALVHLQQAAQQLGISTHDAAQQPLQTAPRPNSSHLEVLHKAASDGELAALRWLHALCEPMGQAQMGLMGSAAASGQLHVMQYLLVSPDPVPVCDGDVFNAQAHPCCLLWLLEHCQSLPLQQVSRERLKRFDNPDDVTFSLEILVATNNWRSIQLLHAWGKLDLSHWCHTDRDFTAEAAKSGNLWALQWLRSLQPPCPWDRHVCSELAARGDLAGLQWARSQQPPCAWNQDCGQCAAMGGHLPMLQWLHAQGQLFPCHPRGVMFQAARLGNVAMMEWLHSVGCSFDESHYTAACICNQPAALHWLHEKRVALPTGVLESFLSENMAPPTLMFLADIGWPVEALPRDKLMQARRAFCTFHGLVRWASRSVHDAKQSRSAMFCHTPLAPGFGLLVRLSRLPPELLNLIAGKADLQHNMIV